MAVSIREKILLYHEKNIIGKVKSVKFVIRVLPDYSDLEQFAITQFPLIAMVGQLPQPKYKMSSRDSSKIDKVTSTLKIDNYVYLQENENPDSKMSELLNDLWVKCFSDTTYGGLVKDTILILDEKPAYLAPYLAFKLTSEVTYFHSTGGI